MSWITLLGIYGALLLGMIFAGVNIGASIGLVGVIGVLIASGTSLLPSLGDIVWNMANNFTLVAIPLFVLMGEIILHSGVATRFYGGVAVLSQRLPGGLAQTNIIGCGIFSAIAGSSVATAMTVGTVAIPEMRRHGYHDTLTLGTLTGGGCLGILIPPSIPMIVYASMTQVSVVDLFMAGVIPGLLLALLFMAYVLIRVVINPGLAPISHARASSAEVRRALVDCVPVIVLIAAVIGAMYFGVVTPTEAAAMGCILAFLLALFYRGLTLARTRIALRNAVITSAIIMFIVINAQILSFAIVVSGVGDGLANSLAGSGLPPLLFFCMLLVIYIVVGMFVDGLSIMLLTVPLLYPTFMALGFDGVWTGVIIVIFIELGALTPPMGLNLFAVQSISGGTLGEIARSSLPYAVIITAFSFLLYAFPEIALWLPSMMRQN